MQSGKISYAGLGVAVGGVIGFMGVLAHWFSYSYPLNGGTATVTMSGTADWTGSVALTASFGAFAFGGAYLLLSDPQLRRLLGVLMGVSAAFLLVMSLFAYTRIDEAVGVPAAVFSTKAAPGMAISFIGGVIAMVGALLASKELLASQASESEGDSQTVRV